MNRISTIFWRKTTAAVVSLLALSVAAVAQDYPRYPSLGSPYVPLDSWVYDALERLDAFGYVQTALAGMKPWTRMECGRLTEEAGDQLVEEVRGDRRPDEQAVELHAALAREFAAEIERLGGNRRRSAGLDSVYVRALSISGLPLTDGFHFGQTVAYDFGRPFRRGMNAVAGAAFRGSAGPLAFYIRAEYQQAPGAPALSDSVRNLIAAADFTPAPAVGPFAPVHRPQLLDSYLALNFKNWQLSFGRQSLLWGPGFGGSLILSDNAEPLLMLRLARVVPFNLPWLLRYLGPIRVEQFAARTRGYAFTPGAYMFAQKISFKPRPYLEIGVGRSFTIGGRGGDPLTANNFFHALFGVEGNPRGPGVPGDSRSSVDWRLRVPGLHHYAVVYAELYADDDKLPYLHPSRAMWRPGFWLTRVPGIPKLDFAMEAASSESPGAPNTGQFNYWNGHYRDGYRNNGFLLGSTVGRLGRTLQARASYHISAAQSLQFSIKQNHVFSAFIPGGGDWQDYSARHEIRLHTGMYVKSWLQVENIRYFPALIPGRARNVAAAVELGFAPEQRTP